MILSLYWIQYAILLLTSNDNKIIIIFIFLVFSAGDDHKQTPPKPVSAYQFVSSKFCTWKNSEILVYFSLRSFFSLLFCFIIGKPY